MDMGSLLRGLAAACLGLCMGALSTPSFYPFGFRLCQGYGTKVLKGEPRGSSLGGWHDGEGTDLQGSVNLIS